MSLARTLLGRTPHRCVALIRSPFLVGAPLRCGTAIPNPQSAEGVRGPNGSAAAVTSAEQV